MIKKYQVFISSTFTDLIEERQAAVEAILRASHIPAGMELFSAGSETQMEIIKRWIEESDIYMLIIGGRYGSIDPKTNLSYTEMEYNYALELNKPLFAVVASESYLDEKVKEKGKDILELKHRKEYDDFKENVLSRISRIFNDRNEIKLATLESLLDIQNRFKLNGWVKSTEIPDVSELINQVQELGEQNRMKDEKLKVLESGQINKIGEFTFEEICTALKSYEIIVPANISQTKEDRKTNVLDVFIKNADRLSVGLTNQVGTSEADMFLIHSIFAQLRIYDLAEIVKVPNVAWTRFQTSKLGNKFAAIYTLRNTKLK